jgi:hypothetical protein
MFNTKQNCARSSLRCSRLIAPPLAKHFRLVIVYPGFCSKRSHLVIIDGIFRKDSAIHDCTEDRLGDKDSNLD